MPRFATSTSTGPRLRQPVSHGDDRRKMETDLLTAEAGCRRSYRLEFAVGGDDAGADLSPRVPPVSRIVLEAHGGVATCRHLACG